MNAEAARILRNPDLSIIEKMAAFAEIENRARLERDGPTYHNPHVKPINPKTGVLCARTMKVLRSLDGEMNTEVGAAMAGVDVKTASGIMHRLKRFGLAESIGFTKVMRKYGPSRLSVWRVTEAGEEYRNG